jgi:hypothetical protein
MKNILILFMLCSFTTFAQKKQNIDTCFTKEQILDISFTLDSLEQINDHKDHIISKHILLDSLKEKRYLLLDDQYKYCISQRDTLQTTLTDYIQNHQPAEPKWYDNNLLYFIGGVLLTAFVLR